jgi:TP901 family phage tail tape measure protein
LEFSRAGVSAAEALKPIQQAGGTTTTILEQMSAMAYYSGENIEDLTKKVLGYSSAYGEQAIDVANSISKIADISNADIKDMLDAFKNATSLNTVVGASFHDVAAALGVMHDQGVKAATAGAALTTAVTKLIAPTKDVQKTFDLIDFSAKDVNTGKFKDLATLFRDLEKASSKLPENMRSAFLADSAGVRGLKFISSGIKDVKDSAFDGEEALKEFNTKLEKFRDLSIEAGGEAGKKFTYLQEVMEGMAESGKYNLDQLYASVKRLFIESYDNPSVIRAMKELNRFIPMWGM